MEWLIDIVPLEKYSFYIIPELWKGRFRIVLFNERGDREKAWCLQFDPDGMTKTILKENVDYTLNQWDGEEHRDFRERIPFHDRRTGEVFPVDIDEKTQKKLTKVEDKRVKKEVSKNNRKKRLATKKY